MLGVHSVTGVHALIGVYGVFSIIGLLLKSASTVTMTSRPNDLYALYP